MIYDRTIVQVHSLKVKDGIGFKNVFDYQGSPSECKVSPISSTWIQKNPGYGQAETLRIHTPGAFIQPGSIVHISDLTGEFKVLSGVPYGTQATMVVTKL